MSNENYESLSAQMAEFRKDVDERLNAMNEKMVTKGMLITSVIVPLVGINLAFLGLCAVAIIHMWLTK